MITLNNFSEHNRSKYIGNSLYRICQNKNTKQWYIHETFNNKDTWAGNNDYYNDSLELVIDKFNSIEKEKEIVFLRFRNNV